MSYITLHYRLKNGASKTLNRLASNVNFVWNYCKSCLKSKAIRLGKTVILGNEAWTTQRCSSCNELTGPKGLSGLSVREWVCSSCGSRHNRDTNAAINILRLGHQTL